MAGETATVERGRSGWEEPCKRRESISFSTVRRRRSAGVVAPVSIRDRGHQSVMGGDWSPPTRQLWRGDACSSHTYIV